MAKIKLFSTALAILDGSDNVLSQYSGGEHVLDASGSTLLVFSSGVKSTFPALATITAITDADNNPVTIPATPEEYVALVASYFRGLASSGGGGGGSVTITNAPLPVRTQDYDPIALPSGSQPTNTVLGGVFDMTDAAGVAYYFATSGNSGSGVITGEFSNDNTTWRPAIIFFGAFPDASSSPSTSLNASLLGTYPRLYLPKQGKYMRLSILNAPATIAVGAFAQKIHATPLHVDSRARTVTGVLGVTQAQAWTNGFGNNQSGNTQINANGTFSLHTTNVQGSLRNFFFQKNTATSLDSLIECSLDNVTWFAVATLVIGDFDPSGNKIVTVKENLALYWRLRTTNIVGAIIWRGTTTGF